MKHSFTVLGILSIFLFNTTSAYSWGSLGHELITLSAVDILAKRTKQNPKIITPFIQNRHRLEDLATIPDYHWKSMSQNLTRVGNPTHYIGLEYLSKNPSFLTISSIDQKKIKKKLLSACQKSQYNRECLPHDKSRNTPPLQTIGSSPWRINQFWTQMNEQLIPLGQKVTDQAINREDQIEKAIIYAGLLSHFVGDSTSPLHSTTDYDGWKTGNGGLHSYYENDIIEAYDSKKLLKKITTDALKNNYFDRMVKTIPKSITPNPTAIGFALSINAWNNIKELLKIDKNYAITRPSKVKGYYKKKAKRKNASKVKKEFSPILIKQLALASDTLANLWLIAWEAANKPDLSKFINHFDNNKPDFIHPDYILKEVRR